MLFFFNRWQRALEDFAYYFLSPFWVENILFPQLQSAISDSSQLEIISKPEQIFYYQRFQKELIEMKGNIDYAYLINKYRFLTEYSLREELLNKKEIDRRYQEIIDNNLFEVINEVKEEALNNAKEFKNLEKSLSPELSLLANVVHKYMVIRTERVENYQIALVSMRVFFEKLSKIIAKSHPSFSYAEAISLTNEEIISFLALNKKLLVGDIEKRVNSDYVLYSNCKRKKHFFFYEAKQIKTLKKVFLEKKEEVDCLKGAIVSSGLISGQVRLVFSPKDFFKFKAGEVLVSRYTSPSFMPVIKQAVAIITDEGGITSHAAIVARELNKPCVVGTRIATKVLKDGDLVEVDANKGIIKIIKRK